MREQPERRAVSRATVLKHVRTILSDGCPRTSQQIVTELRRFDVRLSAATVDKVLSESNAKQFAYDSNTLTYRLAQPGDASPNPPSRSVNMTPPVRQAEPRFKLRQRVRLAADPARRGRVVDGPRQYGARFEYCVVFGDDEGWFPEADLEPVPLDGLPRWQTRHEFLRDLLLAKLRGQLTDSLYSYRASRTEFVPYQFRPVLKFLRNPDQRILIADEVGLGKTIEAAIIYLELKARLNINRVLVLCPSRLKAKWHDELRNRFEEEFVELDTGKLRTFIEDTRRFGGKFPFKAIASFEMMRSAEFIDAWTDSNIALDLLIVDEAHYMRNQDTKTFQLGTALTDNADAVIFLTATPLHMRNRDLYNLLHLLAPGEFNDPHLFEMQVEPNQSVNRAGQYLAAGHIQQAEQTLRQVERTVLRERFLKNPYYHEVISKLRTGVTTDRERVLLQREVLELNTLSNLFTRTRKREVTNATVRAAYTLRVELTPPERQFYEAVLNNVQHELAGRTGARSFATIMKERQAASCLAAMREVVEEAGNKRSGGLLQVERSAFEILGDDGDQHVTAPQALRQLARQLGSFDSKSELFAHVLAEAFVTSPESKVLVFSFFRRTLAYLQRRLREKGYTVEVLNGDVPVADRKRVIERFRNEPTIRILLSSEVGAEGLDFQFCDILVNYDLPWNPMQVEQRIGRLDRFGQKHEKIRIYNFYIAETIETRIFQRLYDRIGIFERSIGDLEAILGEEIKQLSEAALRPSLSPQEQERLVEEAARRIVRHQVETEELERAKDQLLGQEAIFNQQIEETVASGRVISPDEVCALVSTFIADRFPRVDFLQDDEEPAWLLRMTPELISHLEQFMLSQPRESQVNSRFWEAMRGNGVVPLTFDSELARMRPLLEFVTVRHPLAGAAVQYWQQQALGGIPATRVEIEGPIAEIGEGYFFIYQLVVNGVRPQHTLHPLIVLDNGQVAPATAETLLVQLQRGQEASDLRYTEDGFVNAKRCADVEIAHYRDDVKEEVLRRNAALIAAQKAAVRTSFEAKIRRATEQGRLATDVRIERMKQAQVRNLQASMDAKLTALDQQANISVFHTLIAGGRVRITPATAAVSAPEVELDTGLTSQPEPTAPSPQPDVPVSPSFAIVPELVSEQSSAPSSTRVSKHSAAATGRRSGEGEQFRTSTKQAASPAERPPSSTRIRSAPVPSQQPETLASKALRFLSRLRGKK